MLLSKIIKILDDWCPPSDAEEFDNIGLLVGELQSEITKAIITLDITDDIIDECISTESNLVISFHPLFTTDPKTIISDPMAMNQDIFFGNVQVAAIIVLATIWIAWRLEKVTEDAARQERSSVTLGRYFSPDIRQEIENESSLDTKSSKEKKVAILFTDIVGFTKLSENMDPNQVLELLSKYQTKMVDAIFANGGTVDKFIGDSVMATFGTPISRGNDAQNALSCAKQMQVVMDDWDSDMSIPSNLKIKHRIGIHYGNCFAGNAGSDQRVEYTVIGDAVNLASRICEACKEVGCSLLISDAFMSSLDEKPKSKVIKNFSIRGRKEKVDLHEVIF